MFQFIKKDLELYVESKPYPCGCDRWFSAWCLPVSPNGKMYSSEQVFRCSCGERFKVIHDRENRDYSMVLLSLTSEYDKG